MGRTRARPTETPTLANCARVGHPNITRDFDANRRFGWVAPAQSCLSIPWLSYQQISRNAGIGSAQPDKQNAAQRKNSPQSDGGKTRSPGDGGKPAYSPSATTGFPGHIFWVIPAFKVNYARGFEPLTPQDVAWSHTMSRIGIDLGNTALYNLAAEFWPDIDHKLHRLS